MLNSRKRKILQSSMSSSFEIFQPISPKNTVDYKFPFLFQKFARPLIFSGCLQNKWAFFIPVYGFENQCFSSAYRSGLQSIDPGDILIKRAIVATNKYTWKMREVLPFFVTKCFETGRCALSPLGQNDWLHLRLPSQWKNFPCKKNPKIEKWQLRRCGAGRWMKKLVFS